MLSLIVVKEFFDTKTGRMVAVGIVGSVAFGVWLWRHDNKVAAKVVQKIEKQDTANVNKANTVGAKSRDPRTRGVLDPNVRHDD